MLARSAGAMKSWPAVPLLGLALLAPAPEAHGQAPDPSARSVAFAGSYVARARGYESALWNPANLGLGDRPGWSLGLPGVSGFLANNSLSYGQIQDLYGEFLDDETKSEILAEIRQGDPNRRFELAADAGAHWIGVSFGRVAVRAGTAGTAVARVSADALELLLFGNVGEDGTTKDFDLSGSEAIAWATSGASVSYGHPFTLPALEWLGMSFAAGATLHYLHAHGLVYLEDRGSLLTSDPLGATIEADAIRTRDGSSGHGWSLDIGAAMEWGPWNAALSVRNAIGDMAWRSEETRLTRYFAVADFDSTRSEELTLSFAELSPEDREAVSAFLDDADFPTRIRLGGSYRGGNLFSVSLDYEEVLGGVLRTGWDRTVALGGELRPLGFLPLRAGLATSFSDFAYAGGLGLYGGPLRLDLSIARRGLPGGDGLEFAASLSIWPGVRR